ncbi:MAG: glutamine--fructose-6-phosphate transaminase (isomerizing) [Ignavibacteriales bacterium]|nr:glutamine--fructose-6-phosphate transaminase (isomerizing) [Ignavibacteriales bacterium]
MCGIVGYIGNRNACPFLTEGLKRLEYRGYDSAGIAFLSDNELEIIKDKGKISELESNNSLSNLNFSVGIGHTRWATHGEPNKINAHPHFNHNKSICIVHNGIIENYEEIKIKLEKDGFRFISETDSEVLVHLIDYFLSRGYSLFQAVRYSLNEVNGTYGLAVISKKEPDKIIVARKGSPLIIGIGKNENFIASDLQALISYTNKVVYLADDEIAEIRNDSFFTRTISDESIKKEIEDVDLELEQISKGGYAHFMLKEIMEQPNSIQNSIRGRLLFEEGTSKLGGIENYVDRILNSRRIIITACGSSWHVGLIAEYMLEQFAGIPVEVDYASEFRYRNPIISNDDTVIFISQSGETADSLAALKEAKRKGALIVGICNVVGSSIARESMTGVYIHAGPEIGVASTKAFSSQVMIFALLSLLLARRLNMSKQDGSNIILEINSISEKIKNILDNNEIIKNIAEKFKDVKNFLYLGRGYNFPVALEGALKMKEISYIHAEGYPAAEMKHGPIALIDENMPIVVLAPKDSVYEKVVSNIKELKARKGIIIGILNEQDNELSNIVDYVIRVPETIRMLMPILNIIPLQLLAYYIAVSKGLNVDQPRNLAKSVTVE